MRMTPCIHLFRWLERDYLINKGVLNEFLCYNAATNVAMHGLVEMLQVILRSPFGDN